MKIDTHEDKYRITGYFRDFRGNFRGLNKTIYLILTDGHCMSKKVQDIMVHFVLAELFSECVMFQFDENLNTG